MDHSDHRIRLSGPDLDIIVSALRARLAMARGDRRERMLRLIARLEDVAPGNPEWRL